MTSSFRVVCCAVVTLAVVACAQRPPQGIPPSPLVIS